MERNTNTREMKIRAGVYILMLLAIIIAAMFVMVGQAY